MVTRSQAIKNFLVAKTHPELAAMYSINMECQVNVAQDGGNPHEGSYLGRTWRAWTDGVQVWKPFRIPYNAGVQPEYEDKPMSWDLVAHAEGIGMTGWDWKNLASRWVAFDFDAIVGHSVRHVKKLSNDELENIRKELSNIPWVTLRYSASGRGLHVYVYLDESIFTSVKINTHHEHAALARAILGVMSAQTGTDFNAKVDTCGGNMWVWHRKMVGAENGLKLIKQGSKLLELPVNWRDHIAVVSGKSKKTKPEVVGQIKASDPDALFAELTGQRTRVELDEGHRKLLEFLRESDYAWSWDSDHHMLITHTWYLARAHQELGFRGVFSTVADGTHAKTDINCFAFPIKRGGWVVRRYSPGYAETKTWQQDGQGWTRCYLNRDTDLATASRAANGVELPSGGFEFGYASDAENAAKMLGAIVQLPLTTAGRNAVLKEHKDGRLIMSIEHNNKDDGGQFKEWSLQKGKWVRIFNIRNVTTGNETEQSDYDDIVRHVVTETGSDCGWCIRSDGVWRDEPLTHVKFGLESLGLGAEEIKTTLGHSVFHPWTFVNRAFQPEYPGDRLWNRDSAQLTYERRESTENLSFPSWNRILTHIGKSLDSAIKANGWCQANGILTGHDYLKCWCASLLQHPSQPLPYLFLYGPQNSGKSILHEALKLLFTKGVVRADYALTSQSNFNGELKNAILCVVEETDMSKNKSAYNKIKDWVTSQNLAIRDMYTTTYTVPNTTHWIQCANDHQACPVFPGDTRITMIYVADLDPSELIVKKVLLDNLAKEAQDFITELLIMELPASNDRLNVPIIQTDDKRVAEGQNQDLLTEFIEEKCHYVEGHMMSFADFYNAFVSWLPSEEVQNWSNRRVAKTLPPNFPKGRVAAQANIVGVGNISFMPNMTPKGIYIVRGTQLVWEPK